MPIAQRSVKSLGYEPVDERLIAEDIQEIIEVVNTTSDDLTILTAQVMSLPDADATTVEVNITSAQILAMFTTPIELLPAPGVGKYYDISTIILEFTEGNTTYNTGGALKVMSLDNYQFILVSDGILSEGANTVVTLDGRNLQNLLSIGVEYGYSVLNLSYSLTMLTENPTDGDGTLRAIITYTARTFGA